MESCDVTFCPSELRIVLSRSVMWIRIRLDPHHFGLPDPGSKKIIQNHGKLQVDRQLRSRQIHSPPSPPPFLRSPWPHVTSLLCRNLRLSIQSTHASWSRYASVLPGRQFPRLRRVPLGCHRSRPREDVRKKWPTTGWPEKMTLFFWYPEKSDQSSFSYCTQYTCALNKSLFTRYQKMTVMFNWPPFKIR